MYLIIITYIYMLIKEKEMSKEISIGKLLIAKPSLLGDYTFNRVAILLADHNTTGTVGFVINKPLELQLGNVIDELESGFAVYSGGPVETDKLFYIHTLPDLIPNSILIKDNLYWGGNFEIVKDLLNNKTLNTDNIRFFLGYSGWGEKQLLAEIQENSWLLIPNKFPNILAVSPKKLWKVFMEKMGAKYAVWANAPSNPSLN